MNFEFFNHLYADAQYDEIKIIGKEILKEGKYYHIAGMTRKEKKVNLYILEMTLSLSEREPWRERTPRESLKESMESQRNNSFFMHIREFRFGSRVYETAGATSGAIGNGDYSEAYLLFMKLYEAGWRLPEESAFYDMPWENLAITNIEFREEYEALPEWDENPEVLADCIPETFAIEKAVVLECGKTMEIDFALEDGRTAVCYINRIDTMDVWAEEEKKFADDEYRNRLLQHMSETEIDEMEKHFFSVLAEHCPRGKHYMIVEYECSEDIGLTFYDKEYLDTMPKPNKGSASSLFMRVKPDKEVGVHGMKLKGCVIQKPLEAGVKALEAELFSYSKPVQKRVERLVLKNRYFISVCD